MPKNYRNHSTRQYKIKEEIKEELTMFWGGVF